MLQGEQIRARQFQLKNVPGSPAGNKGGGRGCLDGPSEKDTKSSLAKKIMDIFQQYTYRTFVRQDFL